MLEGFKDEVGGWRREGGAADEGQHEKSLGGGGAQVLTSSVSISWL